MSPKRRNGQKEQLKPLSFYGHDPKHVIKAIMQVDPQELKRLEEEPTRTDAEQTSASDES